MDKRVVITGLGVCAPNGIGIKNFTIALQEGISGIRFHQQLKDLMAQLRIDHDHRHDKTTLYNYLVCLIDRVNRFQPG